MVAQEGRGVGVVEVRRRMVPAGEEAAPKNVSPISQCEGDDECGRRLLRSASTLVGLPIFVRASSHQAPGGPSDLTFPTKQIQSVFYGFEDIMGLRKPNRGPCFF